jgi:prevent-host-death family protein
MRTVNVADLKNNLSRYLREVRRGEEILVRDRKMPIAKIVPLTEAGEFDQELLRLAVAGVVRLPKKKLNVDAFLSLPVADVPVREAVAAVAGIREED